MEQVNASQLPDHAISVLVVNSQDWICCHFSNKSYINTLCDYRRLKDNFSPNLIRAMAFIPSLTRRKASHHASPTGSL